MINVIFRYQVTVARATLVTVEVMTTLRILRTTQGAVGDAGPVTDRTQVPLVPNVECESPLRAESSITLGVAAKLFLTMITLEQTDLACGPTLPEPAAV